MPPNKPTAAGANAAAAAAAASNGAAAAASADGGNKKSQEEHTAADYYFDSYSHFGKRENERGNEKRAEGRFFLIFTMLSFFFLFPAAARPRPSLSLLPFSLSLLSFLLRADETALALFFSLNSLSKQNKTKQNKTMQYLYFHP